ncbi:antibiotic biosynthesis monooxygenase [Shewanella sairae]|uniref:Antibiotic biosynthesis monooxygenase n=1 Tax=Shewanella sairae TaxID=190310 RepID=A0ABQ4PJY9_9GAMM|nr:antibiotic biosynthesis monooxygenase [Shewanella sairae]MCL1129850.1 antibiotic biosynthesis monooxygenase [Shewanella sairae]GIU47381.1 antibiotic biosynthesis monooxygenase [Shewanella sairae]
MSLIATTPKPPYYCVVFTSEMTVENDGYVTMAQRMVELAEQQQGFLGMESAREQVGLTVSYWQSLEAIKVWKQNAEHLEAQKLGKKKWYSSFALRIAKVERDYSFKAPS